MKANVLWKCTAWAVTPVHIGSGEQWVKSDYTIRDGKLCRFEPTSVVLRMEPARRREFERAVDAGNLQGADRILKDAVGELDILETIALGPASSHELQQAQTDPKRLGEVSPFVRTAGRPFVPGSSIKGAIRTALLNAVVQARGVNAAKQLLAAANRGGSDRLQQWAFGYAPGHTEQDPFRFLQVSDAQLPDEATRIDRVVNWSPEGGSSQKIQMHVERLRARCDGQAPRFRFEIRIDAGRLEAARGRDGGRVPKTPLDPDHLVRAVNEFYHGRYVWERDRFFASTARQLDSRFAVRLPDNTQIGIDQLKARSDFLLLRLGRFGQFESKSVDDLRGRWDRKANKWITEGTTRNILSLPAPGPQGKMVERQIPFGWVVVWIQQKVNL